MAAAEQPDEIELFDFAASARAWDAVYDASDFPSVAYYRPRLERTLAWVDSLALPVDARVLEVGFGAGRTAIALAQRGLRVTGIDTHEAMVKLSSERVKRYGFAGRVELRQGDAHALDAADGAFDLVHCARSAALGQAAGAVRTGDGPRHAVGRARDRKRREQAPVEPPARPAPQSRSGSRQAGCAPRHPAQPARSASRSECAAL